MAVVIKGANSDGHILWRCYIDRKPPISDTAVRESATKRDVESSPLTYGLLVGRRSFEP